ncbi:MAG TPA: hypothetical protein VNI83_00065, partial [Vicinamibacterales bacterium]|nr:hypothetical protein [Vicinamibacterales bacterium]
MISLDTSAISASTDAADPRHRAAAAALARLLDGPDPLVTHNDVIVETMALVQHRPGPAAAAVERDLASFRIAWHAARGGRQAPAARQAPRERRGSRELRADAAPEPPHRVRLRR